MAVQGIGPAGTTPATTTTDGTGVVTKPPPDSAQSAIAALLSAASSDTDAAVVSINTQTFSNKLEKYLNDYDHGQGYLDRDTKNQVLAKGQSLVQSLDPKASKNYLGYTTTFSHDAKLRFINGTADGIAGLNSILRKPVRA